MSVRGSMFRMLRKWLGDLRSDDGFSLRYGNRSIRYRDDRGLFEFGFEDGFLFPTPYQIDGAPIQLTQSELDVLLERIISRLRSNGQAVQLFEKKPGQ
jgi:hypothetical protein